MPEDFEMFPANLFSSTGGMLDGPGKEMGRISRYRTMDIEILE